MQNTAEIAVTSHVGRDLLSSAAAFKTEAAAVWEYVVNSLQYVDSGVAPRIQVNVFPRKGAIEIHDNRQGMDRDLLQHFFQMHAENIERQKGRPGRGKFGTGKSAAFGIANRIRIETRRNGLLNVVELERSDVESSSGGNVPVQIIEQDKPTTEPNGTSIIVGDVFLKKIRTPTIVEYIERHLQVFRSQSPVVAVNDHICEYKEPEVADEFVFHPNPEQAERIGDVVLTIKVSRTPLDEMDRGVRVSSGEGNLIGIEDCGISRKDHGSYIFGEIDVPAIESYDTPIEPYDDSRSLQLNTEHPVVQVLIGFLGSSLEKVRRELAERYKQAKLSEQARRLNEAGGKIAEVLNEDFKRIKERLNEIRAASSQTGAATSLFGVKESGGDDTDDWVAGVDTPGIVESSDATGRETGGASGRPDPEIQPTGTPQADGADSVSPVGGTGKRRKPKGGFSVDFEHLGQDEGRSRYDESSLRIIINLDHPVVDTAIEAGGPEDIAFKRLSYEIAFSEYAMALGYEMAAQDPDIPADDLLYEVRSTLNRVSEAAASLYR